VPGGLSVKLAGVLAAFAFAGAFRIEASRGDTAEPPPVSNAHTQAALASDVAPAVTTKLPRMSQVAALPALRKRPVRHHHHHRRHTVTATAPVQASATPIPTPSVKLPTPPPKQPVQPQAQKKKSYVGTSFDSNG
jgi:hypothetical protein